MFTFLRVIGALTVWALLCDLVPLNAGGWWLLAPWALLAAVGYAFGFRLPNNRSS